MNRLPVLVAAAAAVALGLAGTAPAGAAEQQQAVEVTPAVGEPVPGSYIVTLDRGADPRVLARRARVSPRHVYTAVTRGFAARLTADQLADLARTPGVAAIEQDQVMTIDAPAPALLGTQAVGSGLHGLDRADQRALPLSGGFTTRTDAAGVTAYIVDTGISTAHPDFGGRAQVAHDALGGDGQDCNGHGTHVAGTVGGAVHGIAKGVSLKAVRVLGCDGSGSTSGIIAATDWLRANARKPAVANYSLGGGLSTALNTAVSNLADSGVAVVVAAGNENRDACKSSPASAARVVTVAAVDRNDAKASYSNWGSCVEVQAVGSGVLSTYTGGRTASLSGTSMASPHVAGVAALHKASGDVPTATLNAALVAEATPGVVTGNRSGTPNRLLFTGGR